MLKAFLGAYDTVMSLIKKKLFRFKFIRNQYYFNLGQINYRSDLGRWVRLLSSLSEVRTIIEIGTWSGRGSSRMIALGVLDAFPPTDKVVIGLEVDLRMYKRAKRNLRRFPFFLVLYGSIVDIDSMNEVGLSESESRWLQHDVKNLKLAPNVLASIPESIDMLILDGGEFTSLAEFQVLKSKLRNWVVLGDTLIRKNSEVFKILESDSEFNLVWKSKDRNGCAIFKRNIF